MNIAIDGHAGSGKSATAKLLAKKLGFKGFNTGAIYRAVACEWDRKGLGDITKQKVARFVKDLTVSVKFVGKVQHTFANGIDYTDFLNLERISVLTPKIAIFNDIREKVRDIQRNFARDNDCVMEGRDIGSEILPNADFKFFITAAVEVRAKRRYDELLSKGEHNSFEEVLEDLKKRDYMDEHREIAPLKIVEDSIVIDNSQKNLEETVEECLKHVKSRA